MPVFLTATSMHLDRISGTDRQPGTPTRIDSIPANANERMPDQVEISSMIQSRTGCYKRGVDFSVGGKGKDIGAESSTKRTPRSIGKPSRQIRAQLELLGENVHLRSAVTAAATYLQRTFFRSEGSVSEQRLA